MNVRPISNPQMLIEALNNMMSSNNNLNMQSRRRMIQFCSNSSCLEAFYGVLTTSSDCHVRQLAGVLMRVKIKNLWGKIENQTRNNIKKGLLDQILKEKVYLVSRAICFCIGEIAYMEVPPNKWPELAKFLGTLVNSTDVRLVVCGVQIFSIMLDRIPKAMEKNLVQICQLFLKTLRSSNERLRRETFVGIEYLIYCCVSFLNLKIMCQLLPQLISHLKECLNRKQNCDAVYSVIQDCVRINCDDDEYIKLIPRTISFACDVALNKNFPNFPRMRAVDVVGFGLKHNSAVVVKSGLVDKVLDTLVTCMLSPETEEEEYEDFSKNLYKAGCSWYDEFCVAIPSTYIFQKIVNRAQRLLKDSNIFSQKCGLSLVGIMAEGCFELTRKHLDKIIPMVCTTFRQSGSPVVKRVALMNLINYSEYCQPDMSDDYFSSVLPLILLGLDDKNEDVVQKSCLLIDSFCDCVDKNELMKISDQLLRKLFTLLGNTDPRRPLKCNILSSIGTITETLQDAFTKYFSLTMEKMTEIIKKTDGVKDLACLRGQAIECVGIVARAVGAEKFSPFVGRFFDLVLKSNKSCDDHDLREFSLNFITNIAGCLKENFVPYLDRSVSFIFKILDVADGELVAKETHGGSFLEQCPVLDGKVVLDDLDNTNFKLQVQSTVMDEKSVAINTLSMIAVSTKHEFQKYFFKSLDYLIKRIDFFHYKFQRNAAVAIKRLVLSVFPHPIPPNWIPKDRHTFKNVMEQVLEVFLDRIAEEPDKETVARMCDGIADFCKEFGRIAIEEKTKDISLLIISLMDHDVECFMDEEEDFVELQDGDHESVVFNSVLNMIDQVSKVWGPGFVDTFENIFGKIMFYLNRKNLEDRVSILGTLAEVTLGIEGKIAKFAKIFLPEVIKMVKNDEDVNIVRNGIFCMGAVTLHAPQVAGPHSKDILLIITDVLRNPDKYVDVVIDNSVGALSRVVLSVGNNLGNKKMEEMLELVFKSLPLRKDYDEYEAVYQCLCTLVSKEHPLGMKNFDRIVKLINLGGKSEHVDQKVKMKLSVIMRTLSQKYPQKVRNALKK